MQVCRQWAGGAADGLRGHRCGAGAGAGLLLAGGAGGRGDLLRWWCAGVVIVRAAWSSSGPRGHRAGPLLIRQAGQECGQAARRGRWAKEKGQGGGAWCAAALAFCLHWRCDLLRRVRPGAYRGRRGSAPRSGAGLLALALIRAQRFRLHLIRLHLIRLHGCRWRCSIRCVFCRLPEGSDSPLYRVVP